jgi:hypothetical protein
MRGVKDIIEDETRNEPMNMRKLDNLSIDCVVTLNDDSGSLETRIMFS